MKSAIVRFLLAGFALFAAVTVSGPRRAEAQTSGGRCATGWVNAEGGSGPSRRSRSFSASELLDLRFHVLLPGNQPIESAELKLFTPRGHLYQALDLSVPTELDPHPRGRRRFRWVTARLPVAGTTIVTGSLYGRWTAKAYLDGSATPCGRPRVFSLHP